MSFDSEKVFSPLFGAFPNSQRVWLSKGADGLYPGGQSASSSLPQGLRTPLWASAVGGSRLR